MPASPHCNSAILAPDMPPLGPLLFSDQGRLSRRGFWWFVALASGLALALLLLLGLRRMGLAHAVYGVAMIYPSYCVFAKRFRDIGIDGAWAMLIVTISALDLVIGLGRIGARGDWLGMLATGWHYLALANVILTLVLLGGVAGDQGANRYGLEPEV